PAYVISISDPQTVSSGSSVTINVTVGGTPDDFTYQWFRNGILIAGETDSTLTIPSISTTDIGKYTCTPNNSRGSTNSSSTIISVAAPAYVISISDPQTVFSGSSVTINVTVAGTPDDFTYQWFRNGILIAGGTDSTLTIPSISTTDIGIYTCTPNNSRGSANSSSTTISVAGSLSINGVEMQNISNFAPPVSSGYTISPNNSRIILTDSGDLIIDPLSPQDTGTYTFTSTDHGGATLTITVDIYAPAYVISISDPQTVSSGSSVTINATVGGTPDDFTYQWFRNGILIAGETDSTLTIPSISATDIGVYTCTPNNSRGSTNSSSTIISVTSSVSINGVGMQNISNFAPPVSSGYTISPNNSRIILTDSGDLITDPLGPQDTGTYSFTSTDHGGATLTITVDVY
uniref:Ig-like domain-containing protein n=1 Tax=Amphimedon queenslandica TaxID=400682 RepID=A0A1X7UJ94_AMPQE